MIDIDQIVNALIEFAKWILGLVKELINVAVDFVLDVAIKLVDLFLQGILSLIRAIPVPDFMQTGLGALFQVLPSEVWFFAQYLHFPECFAVLSAAVLFRLARKAATLFQW